MGMLSAQKLFQSPPPKEEKSLLWQHPYPPATKEQLSFLGLGCARQLFHVSLKEVCPGSASQVVTKLPESKESKPGWGQMCWGPYHTSSSSHLEGDSETPLHFHQTGPKH